MTGKFKKMILEDILGRVIKSPITRNLDSLVFNLNNLVIGSTHFVDELRGVLEGVNETSMISDLAQLIKLQKNLLEPEKLA